MQFVNTEDALTSVGERLATDLRESQRSKGLRDTGASAASVRVVVSAQGKKKRMQLVGLARWRFQQSGRGPNKSRRPSRDMVTQLKGWARRHGLPEAAGYPIALKIAQEGIVVPNSFNPGGVLSEPLNTKRVTGLLKAALRPQYIQSARSRLFS